MLAASCNKPGGTDTINTKRKPADSGFVRPVHPDAIPLVDATAQTVATAFDEWVFCYIGLPEQIYSDLGKQFHSRLMA